MSLAVKYRPHNFAEFYGNRDAVSRLLNRLLNTKIPLPHFYLISGPWGCGKTTLARLISMVLNCENFLSKRDVCGVCDNCRRILEGCQDINEIDGACYRGINEIRRIKEIAYLRPFVLRRKVFIVDEAHQLTDEAASALLKLLEEPAESTYFVLVTTEKYRIKGTIQSRAFHVDLELPTKAVLRKFIVDIAEREGISLEGVDLDGVNVTSFRDALMWLEGGRSGVVSVGLQRDELTLLWNMMVRGDFVGVSKFVNNVLQKGKRARVLFLDLVDFLVERELSGVLDLDRRVWEIVLQLYSKIDELLVGGEYEASFLLRVLGVIMVAIKKIVSQKGG